MCIDTSECLLSRCDPADRCAQAPCVERPCRCVMHGSARSSWWVGTPEQRAVSALPVSLLFQLRAVDQSAASHDSVLKGVVGQWNETAVPPSGSVCSASHTCAHTGTLVSSRGTSRCWGAARNAIVPVCQGAGPVRPDSRYAEPLPR